MSRPYPIARFAGILLCIATAVAAAAAEPSAWSAWRGPSGTGASPDADPPLVWSEEKNVAFKVPIPGRGLASPVVHGDRIFVLTAVPTEADAYAASQREALEKVEKDEWPPAVKPVAQRFVVMALARDDGRVLWQRTAAERVPGESHHIDASWASASPVTDGKRVIAHFGSSGTFAYSMDGELLWQIDLGEMETRNGFGEGSSPALYGDTVVINWDHERESFIVALDARDGKTLWKVERPGEKTSWSTPLIVPRGDGRQVIVAATGKSRGYDLATGRELWSLGGMTANAVPSPVHADGRVFLTSGFRGNALQAVDVHEATGDLEGTPAVAWTHERDTPYVPSPLLSGGRLYFLKHNRDVLSQLAAKDGTVRYVERLPGISGVYASPVAAAGRVYVFDRDGTAVVLRDGEKFEVLATNKLDDGFDSSPALSGKDLIVRGRGHLYRLTQIESPAPGSGN